MPADLLFEIGTEEIPAGFLARALPELERRAIAALEGARLAAARVAVYGTPRRLVLAVHGLADRQPDLREEVVGPPARIGFADDGSPTKAALGFAKKNGVDAASLRRGEVDGKKGEYVVVTREVAGQAALEVLPALLSELATSLPWPKVMRWGSRDDAFVRPVHWVVAVLGDRVVPLSIYGVTSGNQTRGHRFLSPSPIEVTGSFEAYARALRAAFVLVDPAVRRDTVVAELARIESETGARVRPDDALLDEVTNLIEYPVAVCGTFDASYLEVPEEVIVSAMRGHQRYFAMNADGALTNRFVTIAGTVTRDLEVVRAGNQRVLAARLADARFFFTEDQKSTLDERAARLRDVVFQSKLGTVAAKVERIASIAAELARAVGAPEADVARAAALCKADLVTHMVGEFPELQGVMGRHYARLGGESAAVCDAIADHYLPRGAGDAMPAGEVGAVVGVADRIDTMVGCFAVGMAPSGSADPYGLRRAALAILAILRDRGWTVSLRALCDWAAAALTAGGVSVAPERVNEVFDFIVTRLRGSLADELPADCVDAALAAGAAQVPDVVARARAVATLRERADFEPLATAFKRVANILKGEASPADPDPARFAEDAERALWDAFLDIRGRAETELGQGDYGASLVVLAELKEPVDRFFDAVLVMDEDDAVRTNRLALLGRINDTFTRIADFRQLTV